MFYKEKHFLYKTIYFKILVLSYIILISLYIYKAATLSWQLWPTSWDAGVTAVDNASCNLSEDDRLSSGMLFICLTKSPSITFLWPLVPDSGGLWVWSLSQPSWGQGEATFWVTGRLKDNRSTQSANTYMFSCNLVAMRPQYQLPLHHHVDQDATVKWVSVLTVTEKLLTKVSLKFQNKLLWFQQSGCKRMNNPWGDAVSNRFNLKQMKKSWLCFVLLFEAQTELQLKLLPLEHSLIMRAMPS